MIHRHRTRAWQALACGLALLAGIPGSSGVAILPEVITPFSASAVGTRVPSGWQPTTFPKVKHLTRYEIVEEGGMRVLRADADRSMSGLSHLLSADPARTPVLAWRWKVSGVVAGGEAGKKAGDDFAARVYVFFDADLSKLPLGARMKMKLARALHGDAVPPAALCYVWDSRTPAGASLWSPYTDRVRMIVAESGPSRAGEWVEVRRDIAADYRAAFGEAAPRITGVAIATDTDNTGETVTAWYGDLQLLPAP